MLTGYLGEQIEEYFGDGAAIDMRIRYSREARPAWNWRRPAPRAAAPRRRLPLIYGDSYLPIEYATVERRLFETGRRRRLVLFDDRSGEPASSPTWASTKTCS